MNTPKTSLQGYLKSAEEFSFTQQEKPAGTKPGGFVYRTPNWTSEINSTETPSQWLWKEGGGYKDVSEIHQQIQVPRNNIAVVKEVYAGAQFANLVGQNNAPKTRIMIDDGTIENPPQFTTDATKLRVMSKVIPDLKSFSQKPFNHYQFTPAQLAQIQNDMAKQVIAAIMLGDTDFNHGNLAIGYPNGDGQPRFYKIDFGIQLDVNPIYASCNLLNPLPELTPQYLAFRTELPESCFTQSAIDQAIRELAAVDVSTMNQTAAIFEPILTDFRNSFSNAGFDVGSSENDIQNKVNSRFEQLLQQAERLTENSANEAEDSQPQSFSLPQDDDIISLSSSSEILRAAMTEKFELLKQEPHSNQTTNTNQDDDDVDDTLTPK